VIALLAQRVFPVLLRLVDAWHGDGGVDHSKMYHARVATTEAMDRIENNTFCIATLFQYIRFTREREAG
jgi:hypothetical protein